MWYSAVGLMVTLTLSLLAAPLTAEPQLPVFSANNGPVHVCQKGRQSSAGALSRAGEGGRSAR
jgi:hypothetical protein